MSGHDVFGARCARALAVRAGHAEWDCRVKVQPDYRNVLSAIDAKAEFPFIYPFQGGVDALAADRTTTLVRLGHGLALKGVHSAEPSDRLLIQDDRATVFGAPCFAFAQLREFLQKFSPVGGYLGICQHR